MRLSTLRCQNKIECHECVFTKRSEFVFTGAMMRRVSLLLLFTILAFCILGGCNDSTGIPADTESTVESSDPAVGSSQNDEQATTTSQSAMLV